MAEKSLKETDPQVYRAIRDELDRERNNLLMIASENYASRAVLESQANIMTNKYAEGYPGARYYGGCEYVDQVERLCTERARTLFGAEYANVQPHSGSQANMAVYLGFLKPGDVILGMGLTHGGHLTHGNAVSFSGKLFQPVSYTLNPQTQQIDYDQIDALAGKHRPKLIIAGASAYPRIIDFERFKAIADRHGAFLMVDMAHIAGLVAARLHPTPIGVADFVTTTTHKTLRGPRGGLILSQQEYGDPLDRAMFPGTQGGPLMHIIAAKAVAFREALEPEFTAYQGQIVQNAKSLSRFLLEAGFELVSGGTDNHLILVDLTRRDITGQDAEDLLNRAGIVVNKNAVPFDQRGPRVTSGLRLGTPALTTRGMGEGEMEIIGGLIKQVLDNPGSEGVVREVRKSVSDLCRRFPIYDYLAGAEGT